MAQPAVEPFRGTAAPSAVDPAVRAVAEAMAHRDGYRYPRSPGAMKNFLPLAEVAVAALRRFEAATGQRRVLGDGDARLVAPTRTLVLELVDRADDGWSRTGW